MSTYQRDLRGFGAHAADEGAFHELWHGFDALRCDHAEEKVEAVAVGLGLRPTGDCQTPKPAIVVQVALGGEVEPPSSLNGLPVHVEEVGAVLAGPAPKASLAGPFTQRYGRPPCGVSIAPARTHYTGSVGFYARSQGRTYLISNRHVLDPGMNGLTGGPGVQQQSFQDGNLSLLTIGVVTYLGPLMTNGASLADVAATLMSGPYDPRILVGDNQFAPIVAPNAQAVVGAKVRKSGRTTGATSGVVDMVTAQTRVNYGNGANLLFQDCITVTNAISPFYAPGDSGALLTNDSFQAIGMMVALSNGPVRVAYAHRIENVLASLDAAAGPGANFQVITGVGD